jgi:hypothetical protein
MPYPESRESEALEGASSGRTGHAEQSYLPRSCLRKGCFERRQKKALRGRITVPRRSYSDVLYSVYVLVVFCASTVHRGATGTFLSAFPFPFPRCNLRVC